MQKRDDHSAPLSYHVGAVGGAATAAAASTPSPAGASGDRWVVADRTFGPLLSGEYASKARGVVSGGNRVIGVLEDAISVLEPILAMLNTFQTDATSWYKPLKVTAELLLAELKKVLASFASTGLYMLPVIPAEVDLGEIFASKKVSGIPLSSAMVSAAEALTNAVGTSPKRVASLVSDVERAANRKSDPNRPIFDNAGDYVGGVVFFLDSQTSSLADMVKDLQALLRLLGKVIEVDQFKLKPAKNLAATATMARRSASSMLGLDSDSDWLSLVRATVAESNHYPAIKLTWDVDGMVSLPGITGWHVYRLTTPLPPPRFEEKDGAIKQVLKNGKPVLDYTDLTFNGGKPVYLSYLDSGYTDFDVTPGTTYYYWVTATFRVGASKEFRDVEPMSNMATATAINCIPREEEIPLVQTPAGILNGSSPLDPPYWHNLSLRDVMGDEIDTLYQSLYRTLQRLFASSETSVDHHEGIIRLLEEKVQQLSELLATAQKILDSLETLKFSARAWTLCLEPREGGMPKFLERMRKAKAPSGTNSSSSACSIYAAVVLLVGWPGTETAAQLNILDGESELGRSAREKGLASLANLQKEACSPSLLRTLLGIFS